MNDLNILLVEDNLGDIGVFKSSLELFDEDNSITTNLQTADSFESALELIKNNEFDGLVIDLSLKNNSQGGKEIINAIINKYKLTIPIVVYTGTPDEIAEYGYIEIYQKGERAELITEILTDFKKTKECGLNELFNAKGRIQDLLKDVFYRNIYHQKKQWIEYEDKELVKNAILRHTLNHLTQHIDEANEKYFLEEMYIFPPVSGLYKTGSIIKDTSNNYHIILTPACDFAQSKARCILLAEIIDPNDYVEIYLPSTIKQSTRKTRLDGIMRNKKQEYHYLPQLNDFNGGFIDFTSIKSYSQDELEKQYGEVKIQISPSFISDILGRFSSYYARQGQPDLYYNENLVDELLN
ncbi:response regulator [Proteus sp. Marseille-Q3619]